MNIKVQIQFDAWPYSETHAVEITADKFKDMDRIVDSIVSNLKMRLLFHVKEHHPDIWYQHTPLKQEDLTKLMVKTDG